MKVFLLVFFFYICFIECKKKKKKKKKYGIYDSPVIGIDLGTTYSCVSIYRNGQVEVIPNLDGFRTTPSVVSWDTNGDMIIGQGAKFNSAKSPMNTFYDVKRLIGRQYSEVLKVDEKLLSYNLVNKNGRLYVERIKPNGEKVHYTPEQISSFVLGYLKDSAEKYLGEEIKYAVITVPAYFNEQQRQSTIDAGKIAGLQVERIVNEPTAASMTYGLDKYQEHNILVFDLGGGTFDVSLLTLDNGFYEVVATAGDMHLGGEDFDLRIVDHFVDLWKKKTGLDIRDDDHAFQRLKHEAENAKITLSSELEATLFLDNLLDGQNFEEKLTRAKFEQLNSDLFKSVLKPVKTVLDDSGMRKNEVHEIVLVGGSTRIPKVQEIISSFFGGKALHNEVNPDEAVAYGAAIQAGVISRTITDIILRDVTPLSLGIETVGKQMSIIIPRQTPIPVEKSEYYTTTHANQRVIKIPIYEGEGRLVTNNRKLGEFELSGIPPAPKGVPQIKVTFTLDQNSILSVTAEEKETGVKKSVKIEKPSLSEDEILRMRNQADFEKSEEDEYIRKLKLKNLFSEVIEHIEIQLKDKPIQEQYTYKERKTIKKNLERAVEWFRKYEKAAKYDQMKEQFLNFKKYINPLFDIPPQYWDLSAVEEEKEEEPLEFDPNDVPVYEEFDSEKKEKKREEQKKEQNKNVNEEIEIDDEL